MDFFGISQLLYHGLLNGRFFSPSSALGFDVNFEADECRAQSLFYFLCNVFDFDLNFATHECLVHGGEAAAAGCGQGPPLAVPERIGRRPAVGEARGATVQATEGWDGMGSKGRGGG